MVEDTLKGLELGAVETLIVWEGLETIRYTVRDNTTQEESVVHVAKEQQVCICVCVLRVCCGVYLCVRCASELCVYCWFIHQTAGVNNQRATITSIHSHLPTLIHPHKHTYNRIFTAKNSHICGMPRRGGSWRWLTRYRWSSGSRTTTRSLGRPWSL